jgi:hypothetical protein
MNNIMIWVSCVVNDFYLIFLSWLFMMKGDPPTNKGWSRCGTLWDRRLSHGRWVAASHVVDVYQI